MKNVIDTDYKFFSCIHGPKIKFLCPKDLISREKYMEKSEIYETIM